MLEEFRKFYLYFSEPIVFEKRREIDFYVEINIIPAQLLDKQSLEIETVSKATFASNAIDLAVARALEQARAK